MGHRQENDSPESHEAKVSELGHAYAAALLRGDEIGAEIAVREAMEAKLSTAEIDDEIIAPALGLSVSYGREGKLLSLTNTSQPRFRSACWLCSVSRSELHRHGASTGTCSRRLPVSCTSSHCA